MTLYIAVIGGSEYVRDAWDVAMEVGRLLGQHDAVVLCGGGTGVMEAVCRGVKETGGTTVAFLPGEDRSYANEFVDISLPTGMGEMRNMLIVRAAEAVIAIGGEFGTLSEIGFALRIGKPVIGLETWELAKKGRPSDAIVVASDPAEAVERALEAARGT